MLLIYEWFLTKLIIFSCHGVNVKNFEVFLFLIMSYQRLLQEHLFAISLLKFVIEGVQRGLPC